LGRSSTTARRNPSPNIVWTHQNRRVDFRIVRFSGGDIAEIHSTATLTGRHGSANAAKALAGFRKARTFLKAGESKFA
jgi:hypothetical protein